MSRYVLYLDDSGTKEYSPTEQYGPGNTQHFVFGGPLLTVAEARRLTNEIRRLKISTFRTDAVEIKSNWLRIPRERERRYLRPHGITKQQLHGFVEAYCGAILAADLVLLACVVDKIDMRSKYPPPKQLWYPPAAAYELVLQRAQQEIPDGLPWDVVVDDMTGTTPKKRQYRENLRRHHSQLKGSGSSLWKGITFPNLGSLTFVDSRVGCVPISVEKWMA